VIQVQTTELRDEVRVTSQTFTITD